MGKNTFTLRSGIGKTLFVYNRNWGLEILRNTVGRAA